MASPESAFRDVIIPNTDGSLPGDASNTSAEIRPDSPFSGVPIPNLDGSYSNNRLAVKSESAHTSVFSHVPIPRPDGSYPVDGSDGSSVLTESSQAPQGESTTDSLTGNPHNDFEQDAAELASRLQGVDTSGATDIPTERQWLGQDDPDRRYVKTISFDEIAQEGKGWKLHLNFDAENVETVQIVRTYLEALAKHGAITTFKIGNGGGKAADAPGKESTVYIGHRDKAKIVASQIDRTLASVLEEPEGDALTDDIPFASRVMGRFEVRGIDQQFHPYGAKGHPILKEDMARTVFPPYNVVGSSERDELFRQSSDAADKVLQERYVKFYTGS